MKILFMTYASATGRGGHVHSMLQISNFISGFNDIRVLNLGDGDSCVLIASKNFIGSCNVSNIKQISILNRQFKQKLNGFVPDIIHCFDEYSYLLCIHCKIFKTKKFVFTKCGGPSSPNSYWFHADNIILFSTENYKWYEHKKQYRKSNIQLIPNRVEGLTINSLNFFNLKKVANEFNILRIGRIGDNYKNSILSLINLTQTLTTEYSIIRKINVYIIGVVEDIYIFKEISDYAIEKRIEIIFITDERTIHASQLLGMADCVLGTGRGLMEAMSLSIPVLTPVSNNTYPVLVNQANFDGLLATNFSPRNLIPNINEAEELNRISGIINSAETYENIQKETRDLFNSRLSINSSKGIYEELYFTALKTKKSYHFINTIYVIKYIIRNLWI